MLNEKGKEVNENPTTETRNELKRMCEGIVDELQTVYNSEDCDCLMNWLEDVLDIDYIISGNQGIYRGVILLLTFGGPTIRLNTFTGEIVGHWGLDTERVWLPKEFCDMIDETFEELYMCR